MRSWLNVVALAALTAGAATSPVSAQSSACDRACLTGFVDAYYAALFANDAARLPQAARARITDNAAEKRHAATFWASAEEAVWRFDIVNTERGDTGTQAVIRNADGSKTMHIVRLKVASGAITEIETVKANEGDADRLWGPDQLTAVSPDLTLSIREAERDSYYELIAAAEGYWRAFQTNGTPEYHPARLLPDARRYENGLQTTGVVRDGVYQSAQRGFDEGRFLNRNIWDRRYPVVDEERGIVLSIVRFGIKGGAASQSAITSNDRLVGEFFAVQRGYISEIQAVLFNLPDAQPTGWPRDTGPGAGATR
jgi:hypothetical protein